MYVKLFEVEHAGFSFEIKKGLGHQTHWLLE